MSFAFSSFATLTFSLNHSELRSLQRLLHLDPLGIWTNVWEILSYFQLLFLQKYEFSRRKKSSDNILNNSTFTNSGMSFNLFQSFYWNSFNTCTIAGNFNEFEENINVLFYSLFEIWWLLHFHNIDWFITFSIFWRKKCVRDLWYPKKSKIY